MREGLEWLSIQRSQIGLFSSPVILGWGKMASWNFSVSPYDPIRKAPSMNTGQTFPFHLPLSWLLSPVDKGIKQKWKLNAGDIFWWSQWGNCPPLGGDYSIPSSLPFLGLFFQAYIPQATHSWSESMSFATVCKSNSGAFHWKGMAMPLNVFCVSIWPRW